MRSLVMFLSMLFFLLGSDLRADEFDRRTTIEAEAVSMFAAGNFGILENIGRKYRENKSRTGSGIWELEIYYSGFKGQKIKSMFGGFENGRIEKQGKAWLEALPMSIAANIAYTEILLAIAWDKRGGNYWSNLSDKQKSGFLHYVGLAKQQLDKSKEFSSKDPHWYALYVELSMLLGWPDTELQKILDEATLQEPYYYGTYFRALNKADPSWGGSQDATDKLIRYAAEKTREKDGLGFLARGYWYVADVLQGRAVLDNTQVGWNEIRPAFDDLVKRYPDDWNWNAYARFACLSGDVEKGNEIIRQLKGNLLTHGWEYVEMLGRCGYGFDPNAPRILR